MTQQDNSNPRRGLRVDNPVELAEFATLCWWSGAEGRDLQTHPLEREADGSVHAVRDPQNGEWHVGLEWLEPRDICQVEVSFAGDVPPDLRVQYWRQNWPTPAPERWSGARRGWIGRDDPWHGQWTTVRAEKVFNGSSCTLTFDPIDLVELGGRDVVEQLNGIEHYLARFRRTLKLRLVSGGEAQPVIANMQVFAPTTWREGEVDVQFEADPNIPADWRKQTQITNGHLLDLKSLDNGVRLRLLFSPGNPASADGTVVTIRTPAHSFSFLVADLESGPIYIRDYGVFITWADAGINLAAFQTRLASNSRSIYDRVADEPEQSMAQAMAEIPPLNVTKQEPFGRYVILGVEAGRQEFALRYNGELFADKRMLKLFGRDSARLLWPGYQLRFRFGTGDPPDFRERRDGTRQEALDGWLPVFSSQWLDREIEYQQTAFAEFPP